MSHSGAATFKKVSGILTINEDVAPAELFWRSTDGAKTHLVVLDTIDKLQATPESSEKMMLRLISTVDESKKVKDNEGNEVLPKPQTHMFSFNNRTVMDNIKTTLQHIISRYKDAESYEEKRRKEALAGATHDSNTPIPLPSATPSLDPLINTATLDDSLSRDKLLQNLKLQQSLLRESKQLMKTFQETVIHSGLPPEEFWSTRIPLLRAFALSTSQKVGPYNVLSTIKPVASSENKVNVNLSREKIFSIFQNYPIVKKAYTDNVPKNFKEPEFWARFFSSKLFRKLRGERLMQHNRGDVIIDRYLTLDQEYDRKDDKSLLHPVKKTIDLDGNYQDDPVLRGNKPDFTMQPGVDVNGNSDGTIDILKGMNRLSEKMMMSLENEYSRSNLHHVDLDEEEREELEFNDLKNTFTAEYAMINLKNGYGHELKDSEAKKGHLATSQPVSEAQVESQVSLILENLNGKIDLTQVVGDNEINDEINQKVISAVKINAKQAKHNNMNITLSGFIGTSDLHESEAKTDVPIELLESCRLLHSTCCEFLKHFYLHFQSGQPKQANTVKKLYAHLKDCKEKIIELLDDVHKGDGEKMSQDCAGYLKPVLNSIQLAVDKYEDIMQRVVKEKSNN